MSLIPFESMSRSMFDMDKWFRPSTLDLFDPFDELDQMFGRNLMWLNRPSFVSSRPLLQPLVPEKYRVTVDCSGFNPKSIKTDVVGNKVVVSAREEDRQNTDNYSVREFKKTYELPAEAQTDKLASFVASNGKLVIEAPLLRKNLSLNSDINFAKFSDDGKSVSLNFSLPERIDPSKISVTCKDRDIIIKAEDNVQKQDSMSSYSFYQRSTLPENADFSAIKCSLNNDKLTITAPVQSDSKKTYRQIPIEHH